MLLTLTILIVIALVVGFYGNRFKRFYAPYSFGLGAMLFLILIGLAIEHQL